jgi:hypothetical protein
MMNSRKSHPNCQHDFPTMYAEQRRVGAVMRPLGVDRWVSRQRDSNEAMDLNSCIVCATAKRPHDTTPPSLDIIQRARE